MLDDLFLRRPVTVNLKVLSSICSHGDGGPDYCKKPTGGRVRAQTLVEKSFEFLLAREPNSSILRSASLVATEHVC